MKITSAINASAAMVWGVNAICMDGWLGAGALIAAGLHTFIAVLLWDEDTRPQSGQEEGE